MAGDGPSGNSGNASQLIKADINKARQKRTRAARKRSDPPARSRWSSGCSPRLASRLRSPGS
jgi:hypothetical protein